MDYKDKLKLAKEALDLGSYDKETIEYIFPELAEDEKIRKELIEFVKSRGGFKQEYIAWLEKQGEKNPTDNVEPKFKVGDRITKSSKKSCPVHSSIDDTICEVTEVHDTCYILNTKEGRIQEPFEWQDYYELVEPAWSEEDNWIKTKIIKVLLGCETFLTSEETNECIDWIKSIKQRLKGKS